MRPYPFSNGSGVNAFNNAGTFNKLGSSSVTADLSTFNNTGTVNVQGGTLTLRGNGTDTGAYSIASGATLESIIGTRQMTSTRVAPDAVVGSIIHSDTSQGRT